MKWTEYGYISAVELRVFRDLEKDFKQKSRLKPTKKVHCQPEIKTWRKDDEQKNGF